MKGIIVTGTPGTGKTTLSLALQKELGIGYIDVTKLIRTKKLASGYDKKRDCAIVDIKKLNSNLISDLAKRTSAVVIDSHMSHYLPKKHVLLCIVCTCKLKELRRRLKQKGYSDEKVRENLDCEIFETSLIEATKKKHNLLVIDTTKGIDKKTINKVKAALWKVR